jgi:serine/threonine-protein kinase
MTRFRAEATILARLNHPQIATIFELFRVDNDLLMVMEFVRGETLDKLSERLGPLEPERAAFVIDQILSALEHAHRAGVVHRDVKPANVMMTAEGGVKIMDFGIARVLGAEQKTVDGRLMGTPAYMSPEQVLGEEVDGRADLYSVGVLLYRLLAGALPFKADSALAMLQRQIRDEPISLHLQRPELPEWCEQIVRRALMKSPADRFQSAEEFREALADANGPLQPAEIAKTFSVVTPGPTDTIDLSRDVLAESSVPSPVAARTARAPRRGFTWAYAAVAVVVAIGGTTAAYVAFRANRAEAAVPLPAVPSSPSSAPLPEKAAIVLPEPTIADPIVSEPERPARAPAPPALREIEVTREPALTAAARPHDEAPAVTPRRVAVEPEPNPAVIETHAAPIPPNVTDAALVFETRVLVGTKKPKEYGARLQFGDGKITVVPADDPASTLYAIPYNRVMSISYSHGRDPLWNSPQGAVPVARGGGTLGRLGIVVERNWISLRTSTEDQFVAMRFEKVLEQRVLLALQERTGHKPELVEEPREDK